jgi:hypothetical protein
VRSPLIDQGWAALRDGDAAARLAFGSALAEGTSGEALEGLAEALYLERRYAAGREQRRQRPGRESGSSETTNSS